MISNEIKKNIRELHMELAKVIDERDRMREYLTQAIKMIPSQVRNAEEFKHRVELFLSDN